jgi:Crinkler effector protein N-terminal domain
MSTIINLHCWVHGDDPGCIFPVEIASTKTVGNLKDAIKEKKQPALNHLPADTLILWKVSIPSHQSIHENLDKLQASLNEAAQLSPTDELSEVFSEPLTPKHIHVIVKSPTLGE